MGGCRCVYRNCESSTTTTPGLHYFHFPVRDVERCEQWLINARKPVLRAMPKEKLRNKVVCSLHFEKHCFTNEKHDRLIHNAIPTLGCEDCPEYEEEVPSNSNDSTDNNILLIPVNDDNTKFTLPDVEFPGMTYTIYDDAVIPTSSLPPVQDHKVSVVLTKPKRPKFMVTSINKIIPSSANDDSNSGSNVISYCVSTCGDDVTVQPSTRSQEDDSEMCYTIETKSKPDAPLLDNDIALKPKRNNEYTMSVITTNKIESNKPKEVVEIKTDSAEDKWNSLQKETKKPVSKKGDFNTMPESEYIKLIDDNTKQIQALKRLINKQNKLQRYNLQKKQLLKYRKKPNKNNLLNQLKSYLKPSVMAVLKFELLPSNDIVLTDEEEKFLLDLYNDHPDLYKVLLKKFKWKLPGYES